MTLNEALELHRGEPYAAILLALQGETIEVVGTIRGDDLRDVVSILAGGLQYRLDNAPDSALRTALLTGFKYMTLPDYGFNLASPSVIGMLDAAVQYGLVLPDEYNKFVQLATYKKAMWPDLTMRDIVAYFEPDLLITNNIDLGVVTGKKLMLQLMNDLPESTLVRIDMSESIDGTNWTNYKRVNHFYNVYKADFYFALLPDNNGLYRKIKIESEIYKFNGIVTAV